MVFRTNPKLRFDGSHVKSPNGVSDGGVNWRHGVTNIFATGMYLSSESLANADGICVANKRLWSLTFTGNLHDGIELVSTNDAQCVLKEPVDPLVCVERVPHDAEDIVGEPGMNC